MRVFSVVGNSEEEKNRIIKNIISELKKRRYRVGTVKDTNNSLSKIKDIETDKSNQTIENENTDKLISKTLGSELTTYRGEGYTDISFQERLSLDEILMSYDHDFVILDGIEDENAPKIICIDRDISDEDSREDYLADGKLDGLVFAISKKVSNDETFKKEARYENDHIGYSSSKESDIDIIIESTENRLPIINTLDDIGVLVDLIEKTVYEKLPDFPAKCCKKCGHSCRELGEKILKDEMNRGDCVLDDSKVTFEINGKEIQMVPFVQRILKNSVLGVASELEGYKEGQPIKIEIN